MWVEANPLQPGTELSQAVGEFIASQPQGDPGITRQPFTLGGQPAELLENVPGQLFSRVILAVHNDQLYQLWFNPVDASVPDCPVGGGAAVPGSYPLVCIPAIGLLASSTSR